MKAANELVGAIVHVMNDTFDKPINEINLRFAKYFVSIVVKICQSQQIMQQVSQEKVFDLAEQLLTRLLINGLDKLGDRNEGEMISKNLNSSNLRILETCNHTYIFCVLIDLMKKSRDYQDMPKLPNIVLKCLLKVSKIIEKLIDKLDMEKIFMSIHEYMLVINHENRSQFDE